MTINFWIWWSLISVCCGSQIDGEVVKLDGRFPIGELIANPRSYESLDFVQNNKKRIYASVLDELELQIEVDERLSDQVYYLITLAGLVDTTPSDKKRTKQIFENLLKSDQINARIIAGASMFGDQETLRLLQTKHTNYPEYKEDLQRAIKFVEEGSVRNLPIFSKERPSIDQKLLKLALSYPTTSDKNLLQKIINGLSQDEVLRLIKMSEDNELNVGFLFLNIVAKYVEKNGASSAILKHAERLAKSPNERIASQAKLVMINGEKTRGVSEDRATVLRTSRPNDGRNLSQDDAETSDDSDYHIYWPYAISALLLLIAIFGGRRFLIAKSG